MKKTKLKEIVTSTKSSYNQALNSESQVHTLSTTTQCCLLKEGDALGSQAREWGPSVFESFTGTRWREVPFLEILL